MWKCPKCGLYVSSKERRCLDCGFVFPKDQMKRQALENPSQTKSIPPKKSKRSTVIIVALLVIIAFLLYTIENQRHHYNEVVVSYNNLQSEFEGTVVNLQPLAEK